MGPALFEAGRSCVATNDSAGASRAAGVEFYVNHCNMIVIMGILTPNYILYIERYIKKRDAANEPIGETYEKTMYDRLFSCAVVNERVYRPGNLFLGETKDAGPIARAREHIFNIMTMCGRVKTEKIAVGWLNQKGEALRMMVDDWEFKDTWAGYVNCDYIPAHVISQKCGNPVVLGQTHCYWAIDSPPNTRYIVECRESIKYLMNAQNNLIFQPFCDEEAQQSAELRIDIVAVNKPPPMTEQPQPITIGRTTGQGGPAGTGSSASSGRTRITGDAINEENPAASKLKSKEPQPVPEVERALQAAAIRQEEEAEEEKQQEIDDCINFEEEEEESAKIEDGTKKEDALIENIRKQSTEDVEIKDKDDQIRMIQITKGEAKDEEMHDDIVDEEMTTVIDPPTEGRDDIPTIQEALPGVHDIPMGSQIGIRKTDSENALALILTDDMLSEYHNVKADNRAHARAILSEWRDKLVYFQIFL